MGTCPFTVKLGDIRRQKHWERQTCTKGDCALWLDNDCSINVIAKSQAELAGLT
jgi:hypothetical protein